MKQNKIRLLFFLSTLIILIKADDVSTYNEKCVTCVSKSYYYCTKTKECKDSTATQSYLDLNSCEKGISTCLNYVATDLGVLEIPPYNNTKQIITKTLADGESLKLAISNEDSKTKAWFQVQLLNGTTLLSTVPTQAVMNYYNQGSNSIDPYVFSNTGKSHLKPLTT
jgi:hypothetical protein